MRSSELNGRPMSGAVLGEISGTAVQSEGARFSTPIMGYRAARCGIFVDEKLLVAADNHTPSAWSAKKTERRARIDDRSIFHS